MNAIDSLSAIFSKLPGLGPRSSRRLVLHLIKHKDKFLSPLITALNQVNDSITQCQECGNLDVISPCNLCAAANRDKTTICVVEEVADLWALERSGLFKGQYHVLGGTLSAIDGIGPEQLRLGTLLDRVEKNTVKEVIIATNATVEGQTTAFYITEQLKPMNIIVTRLAHGIPIGAELDYLDEGTLGAAIKSRQAI